MRVENNLYKGYLGYAIDIDIIDCSQRAVIVNFAKLSEEAMRRCKHQLYQPYYGVYKPH